MQRVRPAASFLSVMGCGVHPEHEANLQMQKRLKEEPISYTEHEDRATRPVRPTGPSNILNPSAPEPTKMQSPKILIPLGVTLNPKP